MDRNYFLSKIHLLHFFSKTALQTVIVLFFFSGVTVKAQATCGPAVMVCQTISNTTTLQTEVKSTVSLRSILATTCCHT